MSTVSLIRCREYKPEDVYRAVKESIDCLGGIHQFVKAGDRVLLKVNLLSPKKPEMAVTTHPAVVGALIRLVREAGGIPWVGDSAGGVIAGQSNTGAAFKTTGIQEAAESLGAEVLNFDMTGTVEVEVPDGVAFRRVHIARPITEADVVISVPKLKTHAMALFTGGVKNMYGVIPGVRKARYHAEAPQLERFAAGLVDIYCACKVKLTVMDGIVGMEGNGPSAGRPRQVGLILASDDAVSLDAVASSVIGIHPMRVATTHQAHRRGIGNGDLASIHVVGEPLSSCRVKGFKIPFVVPTGWVPTGLGRFLLEQITTRPIANPLRCTGCGVCAENCPVQVISMQDRHPVIAYESCIGCLCCHELCPVHAMELKFKSPLMQVILGKRGKN